jgi:hypothetical protein
MACEVEKSEIFPMKSRPENYLIPILLLPLFGLFWLAEKLAVAAVGLALLVSLLPSDVAGRALAIPPIRPLSPVLLWLAEHLVQLCTIVSLVILLRLVRRVERIQARQTKQAFVLGGLANYLEVTDWRFAEAIEQARRSDVGLLEQFELYCRTRWAKGIYSLFFDAEGADFVAGTDPFETTFKRNGEPITLREDLESLLHREGKYAPNVKS